jgi:hypothetical protein
VDKPWKDRSLTGIGPKLGGYVEKDLETIPSLELQTIANATNQPVNQPWTPGDSRFSNPTPGRSSISAATSPASSARRSPATARPAYS